jgi:hypothetical protein
MKRRVAIAAVGGSVTLASRLAVLHAAPAPQNHPQTFVELIASIDQTEPLDQSALERLIGRRLQCTEGDRIDCDARNIEVRGVKIEHLDFRSSRLGSLLILEPADGQCAPIEALTARFGPFAFTNGCTDGHTCSYAEAKRPWGKLSLGLDEAPSAKCASSVMLNSFRR